jgi:ABC-2 type transport system permease protein
MFATALVIAAKNFRLLFRDRTALLMAFALPIVLATIFGAAMGSMFGGGGGGMGKVTFFVEDLDNSAKSRALVAELTKSTGIKVKPEHDVRAQIAKGDAPAALLIPSGYEADIAAGRTPKLVLYRDPGQTIEQQIVAGNVMPVLMRASGQEIGRAMMRKSLASFGIEGEATKPFEKMLDESMGASKSGEAEDDIDFMSSMTKSIGLDVEDVTGEGNDAPKAAGQSHAIAGIAVMMLLFSLTACGGSILEEEAQGTLQRLRLTPSAGRAVLLGTGIFTIGTGFLALIVLFAYGGIVFSVPVLRAPVALTVLSLSVAAAATSLGLVLAVTCRTRKQLEGISTLLILAMSALGGSWFPLVATPAWYQKLGHFTLNAWAMDGYQGILWYGRGLDGILVDVGVLCAIAIVLGLLAWRAWKQRFEVTT